MKDEAKDQLNKILGAYDQRLAETERREAALRAAQAAFPERFAQLKSEVVRPTLQEFVELLNARGHEVTVREQAESSSAAGGVTFAAIALRVVPKPFAHRSSEAATSCIEITFSANRNERKITVSSTNTIVSSRGNLGKRGEYEIASVTGEVVESHVLQALQEAFAEGR